MNALRAQVQALIARLADGGQDPQARDALLTRVLEHQRATVEPYARLWAQAAAKVGAPAVPTDVFRYVRVAAHPASEDVRVFRTSGTTAQGRGQHHLPDLGLYDQGAQAAARHALFPDRPRMRLVCLAPSETEAPDSSLSYMLARFFDWFGTQESCYVWRAGALDVEALAGACAAATQAGEALALLGTSFAFVHAEEGLGGQRFQLPPGSRIMQTGGFKGRSREVAPAQMLELLSARYGIAPAWIVQEYGMTELSSQMYETTLRQAALGRPVEPRRLWAPGWVRVTPVAADTLQPMAADAPGLLRIDDLANLYTACAIQTSDLGQRVGDGFVVHGRAPGAVPRGCSIAVDAVLGGQRS